MEIAFSGIAETSLTPLVSSISPLINPDENSGFIFNAVRKGFNILQNKDKIPLLFIIEIITLNITTKPPINTIVRVALVILVPIILPRLLNESCSSCLLNLV